MGDMNKDKWKKWSEEIPVPRQLEPEQIEQMLCQKKKERQALRPRQMAVRIAATYAACVLLLLGAMNIFFTNSGDTVNKLAEDSGCQTAPYSSSDSEEKSEHTSYEALRANIADYNSMIMYEEKQIMYENDGAAFSGGGEVAKSKSSDASAGTSSEDTSYTKTDLQVEGVDEGDIVKTDGTYIYSGSLDTFGSTINIYHANGTASAKVSSTKIENFSVEELYLDDTRLVVVGADWDQSTTLMKKKKASYEYWGGSEQATGIYVFDVSDPKAPKSLSSQTQSGTYYTSRKNGNYLYTLSVMHVFTEPRTKDDKEKYIPSTNGRILPEECLYLPQNVSSNSYLVLTALDLTKADDFCDTLSVLGAGGITYVSENNIFVATDSYEDYSKTTISKYRYNDGKLTALASRTFHGTLHDQFSMDEFNGYLRFVATTYNKDGSTSNGLYVLDKNLKPVGSVDKLAKNERIYSARFMGNRAYFVTYRETDPVFLVDLTDPENPVVKDKLKIPGFSEYLHSFGEHRMLGIGSNVRKNGDEQVKLSMFDISTDFSVTEENKKLLEIDTGSTAGDNHKSVLVDPERNRIGLCIFDYGENDSNSYRIYSYDDKGFHEVAHLALNDLSPDARGLYIGNYFYLVDDNYNAGFHVYDSTTWKDVTPH